MSKSYVHTLSYLLSFDEETLTAVATHAKHGQMASIALSAVLTAGGERIDATALRCHEVVRLTASTLEANDRGDDREASPDGGTDRHHACDV